MNLFISISFDSESKEALHRHMKLLFEKCESGSFTKKENIHLTLAYIGETTQIGAVVETLDEIQSQEFEIELADGGAFKRSGGDIYWLGIKKTPELVKLQKLMYRNLFRKGVIKEKNDFKPHLTVSRDTVIDKGVVPEAFIEMKIPIRRISLMKVEATREGNVYTEVYARELGN